MFQNLIEYMKCSFLFGLNKLMEPLSVGSLYKFKVLTS